MIKEIIIKTPETLFFKSKESGELTIWTKGGKVYALRPYLSNQTFKFNLPFAGTYRFSNLGGAIDLIDRKPLEKKIIDIDLPPAERTKTPIIKKVIYNNDKPSPARIYTDLGIVCINEKFSTYPIEIRLFILLHEFGHFFYKTEWKCDEFAAYHYLKLGCNPSNAFDSLASVLHDNEFNNDRINRVYNLLTKKY